MILPFDQAKEIIIDHPREESLKKARRSYVRYNVHMNGVGVAQYLNQMHGFENGDQIDLRKKIAHSIKHILTQLTRPYDAIFSATGGSVVYNLSPDNEKRLKEILQEIKYGLPLRQYISDYVKNRFFVDPNGCLFWEVGDNATYPTLKDINSIYEFQQNGMMFDYLIFEPFTGLEAEKKGLKKECRYYRVVDDAFDALYERAGDDSFRIVDDHTYVNYLGYVPAVINSNIPDPTDYEIKISVIEDVLELADEYLTDMSIHSIYKKFHGFPLFWMYLSDCPVCNGSGITDGKDCYACRGTGKDLKRDVSKVLALERPTPGEQSLTPDVAGYVVPPIAISEEQRIELDWLQRAMNYAMWSTYETEQKVTNTATERMLIEQGKYNRLSGMSDYVELVEQNSIDIVGRFYFDQAYKGCTVSYGKNYYILSYADMFNDYIESKKNGANELTLTEKYTRYIATRFKGQQQQYEKQLKLMRVTPFFHMTVDQVLKSNLPSIDVFARMYADDWSKTLTDADILFSNEDKLKQKLYEYVMNKLPNTNINQTQITDGKEV